MCCLLALFLGNQDEFLILTKITACKPNIVSVALTVLSAVCDHNESASLIFLLWNSLLSHQYSDRDTSLDLKQGREDLNCGSELFSQ